jgi:hypothetical protein
MRIHLLLYDLLPEMTTLWEALLRPRIALPTLNNQIGILPLQLLPWNLRMERRKEKRRD